MKALSKMFLGALASLIAMVLFSVICVCGWFCAIGLALADWVLANQRKSVAPIKPAEAVAAQTPGAELPVIWISNEVTLNGAQPGMDRNVHPRLGPTRFQHTRAESSRAAAARRAKRRAISRCSHAPGEDAYGRGLAKSWARVHRF